ncbi:TonB-dependent receptor [Tenacibaculum sp. IB213877]|uniref:TonB-dependent receptor n=1 Tax=Tenacibaculum sp. IB213877 TaxID=3097351 RepID=UPI002A5AB2B5|nr:TonB-dependent receptor [Tenacibaculum sp. IB213877]MDY0780186.1 TonB-dependent receptor [Tenacibaculum sp. IB213877]
MKKYVILLLMFVGKFTFAQEETSITKKNDTIKTEVVNVVTSYAPKVTDAFKIKRKPVIHLSKEVDKKELEYQIISVPVASTFIPQSGTLKGINLGKQERLFDNYLSAGFGNNTTPFFEAYIHNNTPFDGEYSIGLNFLYTNDPVENTVLSSSFYNVDLDLLFKQEERYFDWKLGFKAERDMYNWYGIPENIPFTEIAINSIEAQQTYKHYKVFGGAEFQDSYTQDANAFVSLFTDDFESSEFNAGIEGTFAFPLGRFGLQLEDLQLKGSLDYLGGTFVRSYENDDFNEVKYKFITLGAHPYYNFKFNEFDIKVGAKAFFSMDTENSLNQFFIYPDVEINYPVIGKLANLYVGASGDLHNNSYKSLSNENPYISPTQTILQTDEIYNIYGGLRGILSNTINYNVQASYKNEENKPLYVLNNSKSNGNTTGDVLTGYSFSGYDYGNSFSAVYDNVKTVTVSGEIAYDFSKQITVGLNSEFNTYSLLNQEEAWHLPKIKADVFGHYKTDKWYATTNIYFVGNRKGFIYDNDVPTAVDLKSYIDVNVNGGYHFNPIFSAFLKVNNITNNSYQKFTNYNVQGIQVIGGIVWKFDALF